MVKLRSTVAVMALISVSFGASAQEYSIKRDDLLPRQSYEFDLPTGDVLANPRRLQEFSKMAEEIGRTSTDMVMKDLKERGLEMGVLPPIPRQPKPSQRQKALQYCQMAIA